MKNNDIKIIGLTGGIGSGKSTAASYFSEKGYPVLDADKIALELVGPGSPLLEKLVSHFGSGILDSGRSLDRKKLAGIVFVDRAAKGAMESIMHGEILKNMNSRIDELKKSGYNGIVFLDIPLLIESASDFTGEIDEIWLLDAEDEIRINRTAKRDGRSRRDILNIMNNQASRGERLAKADIIIENSGSKEELYRKLDELARKNER